MKTRPRSILPLGVGIAGLISLSMMVAAPAFAPADDGPRGASDSLASIPESEALAGVPDHVVAAFEVDGDALVGVFHRDEDVATEALTLWRELVRRIPTNQRLDLVQFQVFRSSGLAGHVDGSGTANQIGRYGFTLSLNMSNIERRREHRGPRLSGRRGNFDWTLIHEFAHIRGLLDGAVDEFTSRFQVEGGDGEGYPDDGSPRLDGDFVTSYAERSAGDEDFAESFTTYVMLDELPEERSVAADKVRWFAGLPGYPELRAALRAPGTGETRGPIAPAPRRKFPFEIAPAAWMIGTWRGTTEDGAEVEYHITADEITRRRSVGDEPAERLRYGSLRDDGTLATIERLEESEAFYLHNVSVAGETFSESFVKKGGRALLVENERLGRFRVEAVR